MYRLLQASAHYLPMLADGSVQAIVCSPPFYGLRRYEGAQDVEWPAVSYAPMAGLAPLDIPGCDPACDHEWGEELPPLHPGQGAQTKWQVDGASGSVGTAASGRYCQKCGGWRGSLGLEPAPEMYIGHLILCLREWRRVLRDDGLCWVNLGDSYAGSWGNHGARAGGQRSRIAERWHRPGYEDRREGFADTPPTAHPAHVKEKSLMGIPWKLAFAAEADGWYLRSDIIWAKGVSFCPSYSGSSMPESVVDRPSKSHEYVFMLAKNKNYYYDADAIREEALSWHASGPNSGLRVDHVPETRKVATERPDIDARTLPRKNIDGNMSGRGVTRTTEGLNLKTAAEKINPAGRNARSVWAISPRAYKGAAPEYTLIDPATDDLAGAWYQPAINCPAHGTTLAYWVATGSRSDAVKVGALGMCLPAADVVGEGLPDECTCAFYREDHTEHFASWPEELVTPMILASTSAHGACMAKKVKLQVRRDLTPDERAKVDAFFKQKGWV